MREAQDRSSARREWGEWGRDGESGREGGREESALRILNLVLSTEIYRVFSLFKGSASTCLSFLALLCSCVVHPVSSLLRGSICSALLGSCAKCRIALCQGRASLRYTLLLALCPHSVRLGLDRSDPMLCQHRVALENGYINALLLERAFSIDSKGVPVGSMNSAMSVRACAPAQDTPVHIFFFGFITLQAKVE